MAYLEQYTLSRNKRRILKCYGIEQLTCCLAVPLEAPVRIIGVEFASVRPHCETDGLTNGRFDDEKTYKT